MDNYMVIDGKKIILPQDEIDRIKNKSTVVVQHQVNIMIDFSPEIKDALTEWLYHRW